MGSWVFSLIRQIIFAKERLSRDPEDRVIIGNEGSDEML